MVAKQQSVYFLELCNMAKLFYPEARDISLSLAGQGLTDDAKALLTIIDGAATGTELLMGLRWHLDRIGSAPGLLDIETLRRIRQLHDEIDACLNS